MADIDKYQQAANESLKRAGSQDDPEQKRKLKDEAKAQKQQYSQLKKLRGHC